MIQSVVYFITTIKTYLHFKLFFDWKWMSLEILTCTNGFWHCVQPVTLHAVCVLLSRDTSSISKQQAASWLLFKNVKWPVVHDVFATFQPLNKRRHMVNHDLLIRLSLIYRYILDYTRGFSFSSTSMTDFWRCELLWYRLPSSAMVDADALVPHRSQSTSTSRFGNLIFR